MPARWELRQGDCVDLIRAMPEASVDAIVTDPPYGLEFMGKDWDSPARLSGQRTEHWDDQGGKPRPTPRYAGKKLGNKALEMRAFQEWNETWATELLRVAKPGAYLLGFGGTRTYHRLVCAIEDAGWEIRDCITWLYGCLDEQTDALTRRGWVRGAELRASDEVCQWTARGRLEWIRPSRRIVYPYAGELVVLRNRHVEMHVTPEHRIPMWLRRHQRKPTYQFEIVAAAAVRAHWLKRIPTAGVLDAGRHVEPKRAYLVGWWLTNAWAHGDGKAVMFSQCKPVTLTKLRRALRPHRASEYVKRAKKKTHKDEHMFYVTGHLARYLLRKHPERKLDWAVLGWNKKARRALYEGLMDGDGSRGPTHGTFWSKSAERRDVFLALCVSLGMHAFIGRKHAVYVSERTSTTQLQHIHKIGRRQYAGLVWCVTVPSGMFVVRRNGKPFVTGNSGFPKSLDVSKALDEHLGAEREVVGSRPVTRVLNPEQVKEHNYGTGMEAQAGEIPVTAPGSPEAKRWSGWGTALKPAVEPIVVARKPLIGTVSQNVLAHGTGALNIDACRIGFQSEADKEAAKPGSMPTAKDSVGTFQTRDRTEETPEECQSPRGRWPANLLLSHAPGCRQIGTDKIRGDARQGGGTRPGGFGDVGSASGNGKPASAGKAGPDGTETVEQWECVPGCPVALLDEQSGARPGMQSGGVHRADYPGGMFGGVDSPGTARGDTGGASRFFYCPKVSRSERDAGLDHLPPKSGAEATDSKDGQARLNSPRTGAGRTGGARNVHPTVKPVELMRWLVRLVTPPDGLVLDPFAGSGSTGIACLLEQMRFLGLEREEEYVTIARERLQHASRDPEARQLRMFG